VSKSNTEEIIMLLTFILAVLCHQNEFVVAALIFATKGSFDLFIAVYYAWKNVKRVKRE